MKIKKEKIVGERIFLRPLKQKDAKEYSEIGQRRISTIRDAKKFIRSSWKRDSCYFGIFLRGSGGLIGEFELCHMSQWGDNATEICYTIKKDFRKKGYATEAIKVMINYCFKKLKFRKIYADTDLDNYASQKILKKLGFKLEGQIRERNLVRGKWLDEYNFGLLKREWKK